MCSMIATLPPFCKKRATASTSSGWSGLKAPEMTSPATPLSVSSLNGAATWVTVISLLGYTFGEHWAELAKTLGRVNMALAAVAAYAGLMLWRRQRAKREKLERESSAAKKIEQPAKDGAAAGS